MSDRPDRYPGYLPYPTGAIPRWMGNYSVPNRASIDWPQAQFAPPYLTPGSPSVSPYRYEPGGPLRKFEPSMYEVENSAVGLGDLGSCTCGPSCTCAPCRVAFNNPATGLGPVQRTTLSTLQLVLFMAAPVAMAISYQRNKSLGWAFLSGLPGVNLPYLTYIGVEALTKSSKQK
jgi:hypothetical protein